MLIARLIADPAQNGIGLQARLDAAMDALAKRGMPVAMAHMLDHAGDVLQLALPEGDAGALGQTLEELFAPCDLLISDADIATPHLFVSDMDSTMIGQECIDELADYAGIKLQIAEITERAMQGELDFVSALNERVALLAGLGESEITRCLDERIRPMEGARALVQTLKSKGCKTVLVTGGFHHFADPVAETLGFDLVVANRLEVVDGKLTGGLAGPITDSGVKRATLIEELSKLGDGAIALATGDGANDIPMLEAAHYGIAYHAKPKAKLAANGIIDCGNLTSVLKLLGIPSSEWSGA
ncbi:phosphoserine phosphatase SerB [Altererythrobacter sp.]|uniref:phosphoserine phosphatase SerB n=1 Tax=Altererythrobacter sp. TaxID=1872480 RepID=UPI003D0BC8BF